MHLHELYYVLMDVYARALALCSGVDLVALLWRSCVVSRILKMLELLAAFLAPCPHLYGDTPGQIVPPEGYCSAGYGQATISSYLLKQ